MCMLAEGTAVCPAVKVFECVQKRGGSRFYSRGSFKCKFNRNDGFCRELRAHSCRDSVFKGTAGWSSQGGPAHTTPEVTAYIYSSTPSHYFRYPTRFNSSLEFRQNSPLDEMGVTRLGRFVSNV